MIAGHHEYATQLHLASTSSKHPREDITQITFSNVDVCVIAQHHNDAILITIVIVKFKVNQIMVDTGGFVDILFIQCFHRMNIPNKKLKEFPNKLLRFTGDTIFLIGTATLLQKEGKEIDNYRELHAPGSGGARKGLGRSEGPGYEEGSYKLLFTEVKGILSLQAFVLLCLNQGLGTFIIGLNGLKLGLNVRQTYLHLLNASLERLTELPKVALSGYRKDFQLYHPTKCLHLIHGKLSLSLEGWGHCFLVIVYQCLARSLAKETSSLAYLNSPSRATTHASAVSRAPPSSSAY
ncbi:hypothetical protein ACLOJK_026529 [Asimina triloba]